MIAMTKLEKSNTISASDIRKSIVLQYEIWCVGLPAYHGKNA